MISPAKREGRTLHRGMLLLLGGLLILTLCGCETTATQTGTSTSTATATTTSTESTATTPTTTETTTSDSQGTISGLDGESVTSTGTTEQATTDNTGSVSGSGGQPLLANLKQAGLSGENLRMAWSIAMAESGGDPRAYNGNSRTGDKSYGLFQINMLGAMGPERRRALGLSSNEELFDPQVNIRAMKMISNNYTNWRPWSVYKSGAYRQFYNQFPG